MNCAPAHKPCQDCLTLSRWKQVLNPPTLSVLLTPPSQVFHNVLKSSCVRADGKRNLVLDVGANFGYYSLYAASMGCRSVVTLTP